MKDKEKQDYTQVQARLLAKHLIESENRRKEKQITEMAKEFCTIYTDPTHEDCELCKQCSNGNCDSLKKLKKFAKKYFPEDSVVLSRDNYNRLKRDSELYEARHEEKLKLFAKAYNQGSKETAEKIYLQAKAIVDATKHIVQGREYLHIDALKEIIKAVGVEIKE